MWLCSGSPINAEILAGAGLDWLMIDGEHAPLSLESIQRQLQVIAAYGTTTVLRVPQNDTVTIYQMLDLGAQNILVPMVNTAADAERAVKAMHYPPRGVRGVGSALARGARWNRVEGYLKRASETVSLTVQIETATAATNAAEIAAVDGVDAVFIGPSDLAASMGHLGQQQHPEVLNVIDGVIDAVHAAGKPVGVNAFAPDAQQRYLERGVDFMLAAADVSTLARASEQLADAFCPPFGNAPRTGAEAHTPGNSRRESY